MVKFAHMQSHSPNPSEHSRPSRWRHPSLYLRSGFPVASPSPLPQRQQQETWTQTVNTSVNPLVKVTVAYTENYVTVWIDNLSPLKLAQPHAQLMPT